MKIPLDFTEDDIDRTLWGALESESEESSSEEEEESEDEKPDESGFITPAERLVVHTFPTAVVCL